MAKRRLCRMLAATAAFLLVVVLAPASAYADQWRDRQWYLKTLRVAEAHKISQGEGVTVAVIDSGVTHDHPDLKGNVLPGWDAVTGGNGNGWGDLNGHGTGMAGLIAAHGHGPGGRNGVLGIAPKAKILPIRVETKLGIGNSDAIGNAIEYARTHGATIISISIGDFSGDSRMHDQVREAQEAGVLIVVGIGNRREGVAPSFIAVADGTLAVGSTDRDDANRDISVESPFVDVVAPGKDILSTSKINKSTDSGYRTGTGSSPSTAITAGAAALVWSKFPQLTAAEVMQRLTYTARDLGTHGKDYTFGEGRIDLVRALTEPTVPAPDPWPWPLPSPSSQQAAPSQLPSPTSTSPVAGAAPSNRTLPALIAVAVVAAALVAVVIVVARRRRTAR